MMEFPTKAVFFAAGLVIASPSIAAPRDWYILDFGKGSCVSAASVVPQAPTPEQFHKEIRQEGTADNVHVEKDSDGNIQYVTIGIQGENPTTLFWFPNADLCDAGKKRAEASGVLPNPDDLK